MGKYETLKFCEKLLVKHFALYSFMGISERTCASSNTVICSLIVGREGVWEGGKLQVFATRAKRVLEIILQGSCALYDFYEVTEFFSV